MSDEDKPVTFRETQEERNIEEHEEGHVEGQPARESAGLFTGIGLEERAERFETILEAVPEELEEAVRDELGRRERTVTVNRASSSISDITSQFQVDVLEDLDLSALDNNDLLQLIAQILQFQFELQGVVASIQVDQLQALFDILTSVEPFTVITVSGVNEIESDEVDEAIPVVPESDTVSIPTRMLFIHASPDNDDEIAIGDDDVEPDDGFILEPGESQFLGINISDQVLWMAGESEGDGVQLLGLA